MAKLNTSRYWEHLGNDSTLSSIQKIAKLIDFERRKSPLTLGSGPFGPLCFFYVYGEWKLLIDINQIISENNQKIISQKDLKTSLF